jgi:HNH endonuclease
MNNSQLAEIAPPIPDKLDIPLTQGQTAFVDKQDYESIAQHKWHARKDGNTYYAITRNGYGFISMHRLILGLVKGDPEVDHIDGNGLNNTRANLRLATRSQNAANRKSARGYTIDGASKRRPYVVRLGGKHARYVGRFATKEEAIAAYKQAKREVYDDYC